MNEVMKVAKKRQRAQQTEVQKIDESLTLKDQLNADVLEKLRATKATLVQKEKQDEEERIAKAAFDRKQREKNMSFEELLNEYGDGGSKF